MTGVLCTGNGPGIELVQLMVDLGEPAIQALADPRVTFFELPTGHWPMLSCPAELAEVLSEAAAGRGHRLKPADAAEPPPHLRPFLLDVPERPRERTGNTDLYLPEGPGPYPAVVFVHGGPVPAGARPTPRDWPTLTGYARYVAGHGAAAVTVDHRLHAFTDYERAAEDVAAAVERVRADPRVDADRIALWFFSGGGPLTADWLAAPPAWLRCLAANYPILAPLPSWGWRTPASTRCGRSPGRGSSRSCWSGRAVRWPRSPRPWRSSSPRRGAAGPTSRWSTYRKGATVSRPSARRTRHATPYAGRSRRCWPA